MKKLSILLFTLILGSLFLVNVSVCDFPPDPEGEYSPWGDLNDDGSINIFDIVWLAGRYGTTGTPLNVTDLLLELETRMDMLSATVIDVMNQISGCSGGVVNIKDCYGLVTNGVVGTVRLDFDNLFNSADYYLFTRIILAGDFDPGSGNIPSGTPVDARNIVKTVANATVEVWYGEDLLKGADVDVFYIAIEMGEACATQSKHCAGIEDLTVDSSSQVTITFSSVTFTNASNIHLSASGMVYVSATCAGYPPKIAVVNITTTYAILALQGWNSVWWEDLVQDDVVQISYTAVEN